MNSFEDFKHNVPTIGAGQATFQQCWYACYKSLLIYHKKTAANLDSQLSGAIGVQDAKDNGLEDKKYHDAGTALKMTMWSGELFKQEASWYDVDLTDGCEAFIDELIKGPLWVSRFIKTGLYHITLATGFKWGPSKKGYIIHNNPYPGPDNAIEVSDVPANVYVKFITSARGSVQALRS